MKKSDPKQKGIKAKSEDYGRYDVTSQYTKKRILYNIRIQDKINLSGGA